MKINVYDLIDSNNLLFSAWFWITEMIVGYNCQYKWLGIKLKFVLSMCKDSSCIKVSEFSLYILNLSYRF